MIPSIVVCLTVAIGDRSVTDMIATHIVLQGKVTEEDLAQIVEEVATYR